MLVEAPFFFIFPRLVRRCQWWERLIINIIPVSATAEPLGSVRFFSQQRQQIIPDIELQTYEEGNKTHRSEKDCIRVSSNLDMAVTGVTCARANEGFWWMEEEGLPLADGVADLI